MNGFQRLGTKISQIRGKRSQDSFAIPTAFEVVGTANNGYSYNLYERYHQTRFTYYYNGNSRITYKQTDGATAVIAWLASPQKKNHGFSVIGADGKHMGDAWGRRIAGLMPIFKT